MGDGWDDGSWDLKSPCSQYMETISRHRGLKHRRDFVRLTPVSLFLLFLVRSPVGLLSFPFGGFDYVKR